MAQRQPLRVNGMWVAFRLNSRPVQTEIDGSFDVAALLDAASERLLGMEYILVGQAELSTSQCHALLDAGLDETGTFPQVLVVPKGDFRVHLREVAESLLIDVIELPERVVDTYVKRARDSFSLHFEGNNPD